MRTSLTTCSASLASMLLVACLTTSTAAQERTDFPNEARERFQKAREYQQKGQLLDAIQAYQQAIGMGMQAYPRAYLYQADALLEMKKLDEAIDHYTKLLEKFSLEQSCRL